MVMKELPGKKTSEGNLLTVTTKLVGEQQESRPLLSPSIDDFLSESRMDRPVVRPVTSNTAVLSTALDLVDLSEPGHSSSGSSRRDSIRRDSGSIRMDSGSIRRDSGSIRRDSGSIRWDSGSIRRDSGSIRRDSGSIRMDSGSIRRDSGSIRRDSGSIRRDSSKDQQSPSVLRKGSYRTSPWRRTEETELVQVEHVSPSSRMPKRVALDSVSPSSPLEKWEELNFYPDSGLNGSRKRRYEKKCTSHHSSSELIWSAEFKTDPSTKSSFEVHSFDEIDFLSSAQDCCVGKERRRARSLLARNHSLEEEFVRAKAAVESDTEFWDKMQAEWEELARRNWLEESESDEPIPPTVSPVEKGYYFHTNNPYREWSNAFAEGQEKAREGDLNNAVLLLEAAILQDPQDSEAWQVLGMTQAENENEQAAIVSLQRCLELNRNNLPALMALAVSFTNTGMQREACESLHRWICHNPRYKHLILGSRSPLQGSPATPRKGPATPIPALASHQLVEVKDLFQEAVLLNTDDVDPDLQTGLGVLFNLSSEFDKAVEAFNAALSVRPEDYLLWNRLGATLANGDRSEEAVEAYTRALDLQPGFIRSRYNLGISCINMGAHREAASNFLTALNQQRQSQRHQVMSANIWAALRIAISMMDRPELFQAASIGDLDLLMKAFDMGDM